LKCSSASAQMFLSRVLSTWKRQCEELRIDCAMMHTAQSLSIYGHFLASTQINDFTLQFKRLY